MSEVVAHQCSCLCHKGMASHVAACRCERSPLIVGRHPKADVAGVPYDSDDWAEHWPIIVDGAPVRCGHCEEPIVGSGMGTVAILERLIADHRTRCTREPQGAEQVRYPNE